MVGVGIRLGNRLIPSGGGASVPGAARPADFGGLTPLFLYHPNTETGTTLSGEEVTAVTGIDSPNLAKGTTGLRERTDALGRKYWRNRGTDWLDIAPADITIQPRAVTVFVVGRAYNQVSTCNIIGQNYLSDGVTLDSFLRPIMSARVFSNSALYLNGHNVIATSVTSGATYGPIGAQLQVIGVACRTTANGGTRFMVDGWSANGAQNSNTNTNMKGLRIGGYAKSNGTANYFDFWCIVGFAGELTNVQADAVRDALMTHYQIETPTRQLIVDGDSITAHSVGNYTDGIADLLGRPGTNRIPSRTRILCMATSGAQVPTLVARRDATNGWPATVLPGGAANNIVAFQIGVNDRNLPATGAQTTTAISNYLGDTTTGVLDRGFNAAIGINIAANNPTVEAYLEDLRAGLRDSAFLTGLDAQVGGANEGRVTFFDLEQISIGGNKPFEGSLDVSVDNGDGQHPNPTGMALLVDGGDTPENGWVSVL